MSLSLSLSLSLSPLHVYGSLALTNQMVIRAS